MYRMYEWLSEELKQRIKIYMSQSMDALLRTMRFVKLPTVLQKPWLFFSNVSGERNIAQIIIIKCKKGCIWRHYFQLKIYILLLFSKLNIKS
ncbi:MAG: hypothetical protein KatS3mg087_1275 [Patescibacteria group bacterium]|nr:MAG: hypothetical protein KatS3mg087_1275 [Patescibacteria group bacterium]